MIGLDTNVLVQFLLKDDRVQASSAANLIISLPGTEMAFVSTVVLVELAWVLRYVYQVSKEDVCEILKGLARVQSLKIEQAQVFFKAVEISADSAADLVDHLIAELALAAGCHLTYTFDRTASRAAGMRLLQ
ncbi:PIN domain-containing protein [Duganella sp. FT134W]|uniref:PIN domain-containing protein n=1 Tax=Duganella margarita TaxID=2692170 RepID=A0A7X4GXD8_9BURK|nr:type II toxin-antitoxin system VapC family toxin [Duganella margarita]MYM71457.1 PIN domain-containing protein [Duganella margarita]